MVISQEHILQLRALPAVRAINDTGKRIEYETAFRDEFVYRYKQGERPVDIFRQAGLDPQIIGYKRIERATARWIPVEQRHHRH